MKKKKIPLRKCIACGEGKPKKELIRVVKNNENEVNIDVTGKMNGRGAYICSNLECLELAQKGKKFSRALEVEITTNIYEELKDIIQSKLEK
ncbi:YlxR family protein [Tissierella praeacuta]|uniref:RNase P modulator RnpM n=1 Tax=Tissierella praeacuta TaxID=43131 RepID=UPI00351141B1